VTAVQARWKLVALATIALAAVILTLSACNSSDSSDMGTTVSETEQAALDFARCMRDNGVPTFPDPVVKPDGSFELRPPPGVSPGALDDALESCRSEAQALGIDRGSAAPDSGAQDQLLELSRCMRENGIPDFPDPKPGSDVISGLHDLFANYDLESPRVAKALQSCQSIINQLFGPGHGG
jgi:hypothetical protein